MLYHHEAPSCAIHTESRRECLELHWLWLGPAERTLAMRDCGVQNHRLKARKASQASSSVHRRLSVPIQILV